MRGLGLIFAALVLAGCVNTGPAVTPGSSAAAVTMSPGPGTISSAAAERVALAQYGPSVTVVSTKLSDYGSVAGGGLVVPSATLVWAVLLSGTFPFSCGQVTATPHPCPAPATSAVVLVDAHTGAFVEGEIPGPSPF